MNWHAFYGLELKFEAENVEEAQKVLRAFEAFLKASEFSAFLDTPIIGVETKELHFENLARNFTKRT